MLKLLSFSLTIALSMPALASSKRCAELLAPSDGEHVWPFDRAHESSGRVHVLVRMNNVTMLQKDLFDNDITTNLSLLRSHEEIEGIVGETRWGKYNRSDESAFYTGQIEFTAPAQVVFAILPQLKRVGQVFSRSSRAEEEITRANIEGGVLRFGKYPFNGPG